MVLGCKWGMRLSPWVGGDVDPVVGFEDGLTKAFNHMFVHIDIVAKLVIFCYFINTNEGAELTQVYCVLSAMKLTQNLLLR